VTSDIGHEAQISVPQPGKRLSRQDHRNFTSG
jgi:hypothetical protein